MTSRGACWALLGCAVITCLGNLCLGLSLTELRPHKNSQQLFSTQETNQWLFTEDLVTESSRSTCCVRHEKHVTIGFGISGEMVQLDVGKCRKNCRTSHMESLQLSKDLNGSSMNEHLQQSCPEDWMCIPSSSAVQRVSTLRGLQEFTVVEGCECRERPPICTRESSSLLLHPGTPYETRLDVGVCSGHCQLGGCRPLRNKTVTVPGPNGAECHSVIEQCACAGSCYRTSYMETVYDYVDTDEPLVKEIDVGRCVGSCSGADTRKCVFRDKKTAGKCVAGLYGKQTSCTPSQFKVHRYSDKEKRTKEVISITACKCL
uniref:CTCK domain-containing protein n=1 Tax=Timema monikensis TaxID=170555 RepID=A0A7R9HHM7_9NEOP|nr:unnamed protein product [Timema monikensis]